VGKRGKAIHLQAIYALKQKTLTEINLFSVLHLLIDFIFPGFAL
jgi:hypothetical protein